MSAKVIAQTNPATRAQGNDTREGAKAACLDWEQVHQNVQNILANMDNAILDSFPICRIEALSTHGRNFALFSHRAYSLPGINSDRIIAGVLFETIDSIVRVSGDISGEESGEVYFHVGEESVRTSAKEVDVAARGVASQLLAAKAQLIDALLAQVATRAYRA